MYDVYLSLFIHIYHRFFVSQMIGKSTQTSHGSYRGIQRWGQPHHQTPRLRKGKTGRRHQLRHMRGIQKLTMAVGSAHLWFEGTGIHHNLKDSQIQVNHFGTFLKWWHQTTMGFLKNDHFGVLWGYICHRLRKHPFVLTLISKYRVLFSIWSREVYLVVNRPNLRRWYKFWAFKKVFCM